MRNIFDQYTSPENRLTHALGSCLNEDRELLHAFVTWITGKKPTSKNLDIVEQQIPGEPFPISEIDRGLPDLWIHDGESWSLLVENKIESAVSLNQLRRHLNTARRSGFSELTLLVLAPDFNGKIYDDAIHRTWPQVYSWLRKQPQRSKWVDRMIDYMEAAEMRMIADGYLGERTITEYAGIPFGSDHPYTYREAKRVLRLVLNELRRRKDLQSLGMDSEGQGRPAITGREGTSVWDFLPLKHGRGSSTFTACPHLTISIREQHTLVIVTLPNAVPAAFRNNLIRLGRDGFRDLVLDVEAKMTRAIGSIEDAHPVMEVVQRYYPSQRSTPVTHAKLEFNLRTSRKGSDPVKYQPQWLSAAFDAMEDKRSNIQIGIGAKLPHKSETMQSRESLNVIAGVWLACEPWLKTILGY